MEGLQNVLAQSLLVEFCSFLGCEAKVIPTSDAAEGRARAGSSMGTHLLFETAVNNQGKSPGAPAPCFPFL